MNDTNNAQPYDYDSGYASWKEWNRLFDATPDDSKYYAGQLSNLGIADKRVLEIGFGAGSFMQWARLAGANISGCELIAELCKAGTDKGYDTRLGSADIFLDEEGSFDLIVAFDVMEHIPKEHLSGFMVTIRRLLKPGGVFLARTPNGGSPWGLSFQNGDISHENALSTGRFQQLAVGAGLKLTSCANAYRVSKDRVLPLDALRFWVRDLLEKGIAAIYGTGRVPLDPNIVARFKKP